MKLPARRALSYAGGFGGRAWAFYQLTLQSEIPIRSASLAFSTILSIVPFLTIVFAVFANFPAFSTMQKQLEEALLGVILPQASNTLREVFRQFTSNSGKLTAIGFLTLFITAASVFLDLNSMVNRIWEVRTRRNILQNLTIFWLALTLGPFLLAATFVLSGELAGLLRQLFPNTWLFARAGKVLSWLSGFTFLYLIFTALPHTQIRKRQALLAALVTTLALNALNLLFTFWYGRFTSYNAIYGSLSAVPLFFLWMYLNWYVILLGVQFHRFLSRHRVPEVAFQDSRLASPELAILLALGECAYRHQGGLTEPELASLVPVSADRFQAGLDWLAGRTWIAKAGDRWVLSAPPESIPLTALVSFSLPAAQPGGSPVAAKLRARMAKLDKLTEKTLAKKTLRELLA